MTSTNTNTKTIWTYLICRDGECTTVMAEDITSAAAKWAEQLDRGALAAEAHEAELALDEYGIEITARSGGKHESEEFLANTTTYDLTVYPCAEDGVEVYDTATVINNGW